MTHSAPELILYDLLAQEAITRGRRLTKDEYLAAFRSFFAKQFPEGKRKPKRQLPINKMTDAEFMEFLHAEETLRGIDIERHIGICRFHFKAKGVTPSRMRIINWLNRVDKNLENHGRDAETRAREADERKTPPPDGWLSFMREKQRDWGAKNGDYNPPTGVEDNFFTWPASWRAEARRRLA